MAHRVPFAPREDNDGDIPTAGEPDQSFVAPPAAQRPRTAPVSPHAGATYLALTTASQVDRRSALFARSLVKVLALQDSGGALE